VTAGRPLRALPADGDLVPALRAALDGSGPAVLPLPRTAVAPGVVADLLAAARLEQPLEHEDVALVMPTSGSTGEPKLALLTAAALHASAGATSARLGGPGRWVLALPLTHVAGLQVVVRSLLAGTEPVIVDTSAGFTPEAFGAAGAQLGGERAYVSLVPTQLRRLVDAGTDLSSYAAILVGGAAADDALVAAAAALGGPVVRTYGMTETCGGCVYDGEPLDGVRFAVDDAGLVRLGGATLAAGYRLRPDLDEAAFLDGWFRTADLGAVGADGRLRVLGRADDVIVTGGEKVAAAEVEAVLRTVPGVRDVAVAAVPDAEWGHVVAALVEVAEPADGRMTPDALRAAVRERLGPVAVPRRLLVVDALPRTALGKADRLAVRRILEP
jgi:O-succinylbenzoic acid--CoA ligase